eukprot:CAMPEP_0172908578 /NCGR_PEP_ID=MMETSP1075-20121228/181022_1 /TAXON_ID=2916 /ORGANISM="Ceratium fusus, Strain PA161109" /LENGTH=84 /DNA_ID=CAMNT_0013766373 /DNA_START=20 /DNA_END=270 /DNA_ORIENTATION=-
MPGNADPWRKLGNYSCLFFSRQQGKTPKKAHYNGTLLPPTHEVESFHNQPKQGRSILQAVRSRNQGADEFKVIAAKQPVCRTSG